MTRSRILRARMFLPIVLVLALVAAVPAQSADDADGMWTLVTTEWLSRHLGDGDLIVLDCTVRLVPQEGGGMASVSGRADYDAGHIPTAGFADLKGELSDPDSPLEYALPTPESSC